MIFKNLKELEEDLAFPYTGPVGCNLVKKNISSGFSTVIILSIYGIFKNVKNKIIEPRAFEKIHFFKIASNLLGR